MKSKISLTFFCMLFFGLNIAYAQTRTASYSTEQGSNKKVDGVPYASYVLALDNFSSQIEAQSSSNLGVTTFVIDLSGLNQAQVKIQDILERGRINNFTQSTYDKESNTVAVKTTMRKITKRDVAHQVLWKSGLR